MDYEAELAVVIGKGGKNIPEEKAYEHVAGSEGEGINVLSGLKITPPRSYAWTRKLNWNMDPGQAPVQDSTNLNQAYSDLLNQDYD